MNEKTQTVTPRLPDGTRLHLVIDKKIDIPRGRRWQRKVVDMNTDKEWLLKGASCGAPRCFCDAMVVMK